jgi:hypothetical protein
MEPGPATPLILANGSPVSDANPFPVKGMSGGTGGASELHLGEVGGRKKSVAVEFTRPADGIAYAALDALGVNLTVTGATNATPVVVTTGTHSLADGDPVTVASVGGNTAANGDFFAKVTGYSSTTFGLYSDKALTTPVAGNSAYTSGGTVARLFRLPNAARLAAGSGYVVKAQVFTDQKTNVAQIKVHLFNAPVTAILDNSPYLRLYASRAARVGEITLPVMGTEDPTNSTAAAAVATPNTAFSNLPLSFNCAGGDPDLYFIPETLTAFTPASGENFYFRFAFEVD